MNEQEIDALLRTLHGSEAAIIAGMVLGYLAAQQPPVALTAELWGALQGLSPEAAFSAAGRERVALMVAASLV